MGIPGLWEKLGDGETVDLATLLLDISKKPKDLCALQWMRPAGDTIATYPMRKLPEFAEGVQPAANPSEKNILWRVLQLLRLNIQLIFVTDGPGRPQKKGKLPRGISDDKTKLLREMLERLGIRWHKAPGEAEAECAELQRLGIVDAVWTDDGDALMFGCQVLVRFFRKPASGKKDLDKVKIYRLGDISKKYPGLDREGLVLFAVLIGGDYDRAGLPGCGPERVLEAGKYGLGKTLCEASIMHQCNQEQQCEHNLPAWRDKLLKYVAGASSSIPIPQSFPKARHVRNYKKPKVSDPDVLWKLQQDWDTAIDEETLWPFLARKFNFWVKEYIERIIPILLVRSLAQTQPGQEASNGYYQLKRIAKAGSVESRVSFLLAAVTTLDIDSWMSETLRIRLAARSEQPPARAECDKVLDYILRHAIPQSIQSPASPAVSRRQPSQPNPGTKRGRPPKEHVNKDAAQPAKKAKYTAADPPQKPQTARPIPAPLEKKRVVVDLTSDNEDETLTSPFMPTTFSPKTVAQTPRLHAQHPKDIEQSLYSDVSQHSQNRSLPAFATSPLSTRQEKSFPAKVLAPLSPHTMRQARLGHFEPQLKQPELKAVLANTTKDLANLLKTTIGTNSFRIM